VRVERYNRVVNYLFNYEAPLTIFPALASQHVGLLLDFGFAFDANMQLPTPGFGLRTDESHPRIKDLHIAPIEDSRF